jgi:prepilin-type N-terminal cleavage/methylation domain-containing protein
MPTSATCSNKIGFTLIEVLMALLIIAVLAALISRILQSSLLTHQLIEEDLKNFPIQQKQINLQLAGEREEPVLLLIPVEEQEK